MTNDGIANGERASNVERLTKAATQAPQRTYETGSTAGQRWSRSIRPGGVTLIAIMGVAALGGLGHWLWREGEIDTAVADAAPAVSGEGSVLEIAIENLRKLENAIERADEAAEAWRRCLLARKRVESLASVPALASSLDEGDRMVIVAGELAGAGELAESLETLFEARSRFEALHVRVQKETEKLLEEARTRRAGGEHQQALTAMESALAMAPENEDVRQLHSQVSADVLVVKELDTGHAKLSDGDLPGAAESFSRALERSPRLEPSRNREAVSEAFLAVAEAYRTGTGVGRDCSQAVIWYGRAGLVFSAAGQRDRSAACHFLEGACLQRDVNPQGSWSRSARAFERAALEYKALHMPDEYLRSRDAQVHAAELGGDWNTAAGIHKELAALHASAQNAGAQADSLSRQAYCLEPSRNQAGSWGEASDLYKDAIRIYKKLGPEYSEPQRLAMLRQHECVEEMRKGR